MVKLLLMLQERDVEFCKEKMLCMETDAAELR
jgi:hypothetical protein